MAGDPSRQARPDKGGRKPAKGNAHGPIPKGMNKGTPSGEYKRKAANLSQRQLKAAGAAKAAKARTVSISSTKRITSGPNKGKTVGPGGKPLTGTVMINGQRAVYKDGKRVMVAPKTKAPASGNGRSATGPAAPPAPPAVPTSTRNRGNASSTRRTNQGQTSGTTTSSAAVAALTAKQRAAAKARAAGGSSTPSRDYQMPASASASSRPGTEGTSPRPGMPGYGRPYTSPSSSRPSAPTVKTRRVRVNGVQYTEKWVNGKWVRQ